MNDKPLPDYRVDVGWSPIEVPRLPEEFKRFGLRFYGTHRPGRPNQRQRRKDRRAAYAAGNRHAFQH